MPPLPEKNIHRVFIASLVLKGLNSLLEIIAGTLFLFTGTLTSVISSLIQSELVEDPHDFFASNLQHILPYFSMHAQLYAAFYLLTHGLVKIVLVISLLRHKLWAYPGTIIVLCLFVAYQTFRLSYGFSTVLFLLTLFDIFLIFLTWNEYQVVKKHLP